MVMFHENLKKIRQQNKMSQEEAADRLHVARQTLSKWERGLSVPDADMLIQLSEILQVSVSVLLGSKEEKEETHDVDIISKKLEAINFALSEKNKQSKKFGK